MEQNQAQPNQNQAAQPQGGQPSVQPQVNVPGQQSGQPAQQQQPNTPSPYSQGPETPSAIPQGLEKFVGSDGKVDMDKLSKSYLEVEKSFRQGQAQTQQLQQTLAALNESNNQNGQGNQQQVTPNEQLIEKFIADPKKFIGETFNELAGPVQEQLGLATLKAKHREFDNPEFVKDFYGWLDALPPSVRGVDTDLDGADWLVNLYKERKGIRPSTPNQPSHEGPSAGRPGSSQIRFSRSGMKHLYASDPNRYRDLEADYQLAWKEGRVDP